MIMNSVQQVTYDYIVSEYHRGRPEGFSDANSFDLYTYDERDYSIRCISRN